MGISLNGLTPAGTYPGLIKTGDNTAISGTPKVLSDGNGNNLPMEVSTTGVNLTGSPTVNSVAIANTTQVAAKQDTLVSGTNIKTINGTSVLGSGNITTPNVSGVAGAIQFSNGSAFASDAANLFWDDTNNRLGVGTNAPARPLTVVGSTNDIVAQIDALSNAYNTQLQLRTYSSNSAELLITGNIGTTPSNVGVMGGNTAVGLTLTAFGSNNIQFYTTNSFVPRFRINNDGNIGAGTTSPTAKMHIQGSGSTSATTSLLVQNSAGTTALQVQDNLTTTLGGSLTMPNFSTINGGTNSISFETGRTIFTATAGTFGGQYAFLFNDGGATNTATSGTLGRFNLVSRFAPTSGTAVYNTALINPIVNQTGGANGITRGLFIDPTLTAAADFRAIQTTAGKIIFGGLPTSSAGLVSGQLWNDAGTLKIA
jgi:hypothetical protein